MTGRIRFKRTTPFVASILSTLFLAPPLLAQSDVHLATYDGRSINDNRFGNPRGFLAQLDIQRKDGDAVCSGVAIAKDIVLTAAHCLIDAKSVKVNRLSHGDKSWVTYTAKSWTINEKHNNGFPGEGLATYSDEIAFKFRDIGVIYVGQDAFEDPISIAPLNLRVEQLADPQVYFFGRGRDPIFELNEMAEYAKLERLRRLPGGNVYRATVSGPGAVCGGDSGGPVTILAKNGKGEMIHYLIGITFGGGNDVKPRSEAMPRAIKHWGGIQKMPTCGKSFLFAFVATEIGWFEQAIQNLVYDDPGKRVFIVGE